MPDTEVRTLSQSTSTLTYCPVFVTDEHDNIVQCGTVLKVMLDTFINGDDYGSWTTYGVYFDCGHSFNDMEQSLRNEEYV